MSTTDKEIRRLEVEALKANWRRDPCYPLEETPGFEAEREELKAYAIEMKAFWKKKRAEHQAHLESLICPTMSANDGDEFTKCQVQKCALWRAAVEKCGQIYSIIQSNLI